MPSCIDIIPQSHNNATRHYAGSLPSSSSPVSSPSYRPIAVVDASVSASLEVGSDALGIYGKSASAFPRETLVLINRFSLQSVARYLLPGQGVAGCLRRRQSGRDTVDLWYLPAFNRAAFGGLQTCSSVWACPVCSAKITERRRVEVRSGIDAWKVQGGEVVLVTYTIRHKSTNSLSALLSGLLGSLRRVTSGRSGAALRALCGYGGSIRSLEVTWGLENGWHPHIHQLLFVSAGVDYGLLTMQLRRAWSSALCLENMAGVTSRGVDLRHTDADVSDYIAKMGVESSWGVEHELVKGPSKIGRSVSPLSPRYSPFQLLSEFSATGDRVFADLFQDYASALKGRRQLVWSPGLRNSLGLIPELTDAEIAEKTEADAVLLAALNKYEWSCILRADLRAELLVVASSGSVEKVRFYLDALISEVTPDEKTRMENSANDRGFSVERMQLEVLREEAACVATLRECDAWQDGLTLSEKFGAVSDVLASALPSVLLDVVSRPARRLSLQEKISCFNSYELVGKS